MSQLEELKTQAEVLREAVLKGWTIDLERDDRRFEPAAVYASGRRRCLRAMALDLIAWDQKPTMEPDRLERMRRGKEREKSIIARLIQVGNISQPRFEVIHEQYGENLRDRSGRIVIRMKIDGRLKFDTGVHPPFEIKSYTPNLAARIKTIEDFSLSPWTWNALDQMLMYLLAHNEPFGYFVLEQPGLPRLIPVYLEEHFDRAEEFLREAEQAMDAKADYATQGPEALPPFIQDQSECRRCPHFQRACQPPVLAGQGAVVVDDPEIETLLSRREELFPSHAEFQQLDKRLKERFEQVELALCGEFQITGKSLTRKGYEVKEGTYWQCRIERLVPQSNGKSAD